MALIPITRVKGRFFDSTSVNCYFIKNGTVPLSSVRILLIMALYYIAKHDRKAGLFMKFKMVKQDIYIFTGSQFNANAILILNNDEAVLVDG